ncbi:MAG: DUF4342 domain-containing protein [Methanobacteriota archaeon]|nr:MAG: DUF4342 domain-containing protein [Euryarchaeota archaeon]
MVFCSRCGKELVPEANYCPYCGIAVKGVKTEEYTVPSEDLVSRVKALVHEGNVNRVIVKDDKGRVLMDIPIALGVVGVVLAPWLAALGALGVVATNCTIVVERREG